MFSCIGGTFSIFPYITHKCFSKANFSVMYGFLQCAVVSGTYYRDAKFSGFCEKAPGLDTTKFC